jgi:hypothetical protein
MKNNNFEEISMNFERRSQNSNNNNNNNDKIPEDSKKILYFLSQFIFLGGD